MNNKEIIEYAGSKFGKSQAEAIMDIIEQNNYKNILNIGVYKGGSALIMGLICKRRGYGKVYCVDPYIEKDHFIAALKEFKQSIKDLELEEYCQLFQITSKEFFSKNQIKFDFAFIDGDHSVEGVKLDILGCSKITNDILCHDWEHHRGKKNIKSVREGILQMVDEGVVKMAEEIEKMARLKPI